jgi:hypothetical protein
VLSFQSDGGVRGRRTDGPLSRFPAQPVGTAVLLLAVAALVRDLARRR